MNIIIDIILLAIIILSAFFAAKKGFIGTLFSLASTLVAIVLSVVLSSPVSVFLDNNFVNPSVKSYIVSVVDNSAIGQSYEDALASIDVASKIESMPSGLRSVLEIAEIDVDKIANKAKEITDNSTEKKDELINSIASPISGTISKVIALVGLFIILNIALWIVSKLLTAIFNLIPVGKKLNKFGGLLFGVLRGLIIIFVVSTLFTAISRGVSPDSNNIFSQSTIEKTVILKSVSGFNPVSAIMNIKY